MKKLIYLIVVIVALGLIVSGCIPVVPPLEQGDLSTLTKQVPTAVYVATTGADTNSGTSEEPFATIQAAIDAASDGDTIIVAAGIYEEEVKIMDKSLTLSGAQADIPIVNGGRAGDESIIRGKGTSGYPYFSFR